MSKNTNKHENNTELNNLESYIYGVFKPGQERPDRVISVLAKSWMAADMQAMQIAKTQGDESLNLLASQIDLSLTVQELAHFAQELETDPGLREETRLMASRIWLPEPLRKGWAGAAEALIADEGACAVSLASIGHRYFGNPIPQEWYSAATYLIKQVNAMAPSDVPANGYERQT